MLDKSLLEQLKEPLSAIQPMTAVFDHEYVQRIDGPNVRSGGSKMDHAEMLMDDIAAFRESTGVGAAGHDLVRLDGSLPPARRRAPTLADFECGLQKNDPEISPSQIYAYAALKIGRPLRQRRAAPDHRYAGAAGTGARTRRCRSAARISKPARRS